MCINKVRVGCCKLRVVSRPRWEESHLIANKRNDVRLVDSAGRSDEIAEVIYGLLCEAQETIDSRRGVPTTFRNDPARCREVMEGHHRFNAMRVTRREHASVMIERGN